MSTELATIGPDIEPIHGHFTAQEVDTALLTLALMGGDTHKAAEVLKEQGIDVSTRSLRRWRVERYPKRYAHLSEQHRQEIIPLVKAQARTAILRVGEVILEGIERTQEGLKDLDAKDAAGATKNLALTLGIVTDKLALQEDRPTQIVHHSAAEILSKLERLGWQVVDGTAEELTA